MTDEIYKKLIADKIVVIMRGLLKDKAIACCEALASEGIRFMEIPLNTVGALEIIAILAKHFSGRDIYIGAGTVLCPDDVSAVKNAGGQYIISPNVCETVITKTKELGMLSMPGFQTATEAFMAMNAGADILKMFPCSNIDEIAVLKSRSLPSAVLTRIMSANICGLQMA